MLKTCQGQFGDNLATGSNNRSSFFLLELEVQLKLKQRRLLPPSVTADRDELFDCTNTSKLDLSKKIKMIVDRTEKPPGIGWELWLQ